MDGLISLCNDTANRCPSGFLLDPPSPPPSLVEREPPCPGDPVEGGGEPSADAEQNSLGCSAGSGSCAPTNGHPVAQGDALKGPVLVLLDMNGTLLYRAKKPLPVSKGGGDNGGGGGGSGGGGGAGTVAFVHGDPVPLQYYMRPGAAELVAEMSRHPRVHLAFYTSMRGVNALPAATFLMPEDFRRWVWVRGGCS